ncbi:MAG: DUF1549 domain-containing protein, partial [Planctomycetales bacterium]
MIRPQIRPPFRRLTWLVLATVILWPSLGDSADPVAIQPTREQLKFFEKSVRPVLANRCLKCHGADKQEGDLRLDSLSAIKSGGESGPAVQPGKPAKSLLVEAIQWESLEMPPKDPLPAKEIKVLVAWVKMGAPWPSNENRGELTIRQRTIISDKDRSWWAFQPVKDPPVPNVDDQGWSRNDVDRFIFRRLASEGISPSEEASKRRLIRRLYFDLIGLPPTPEEVEAFVSNDSSSAYEELVEHLLSRPQYGEKWARHWL